MLILYNNVVHGLRIEHIELIFTKKGLDLDHTSIFGCDVMMEIPTINVEQLREVTFEERRGGRPWNVIEGCLDDEATQNAIKCPEDSERKDSGIARAVLVLFLSRLSVATNEEL